MHTAVLFLVFNRPNTTQKVFKAIQQAKPPKLYVAADGPRSDRAGEIELCNAVRQISTAVDWPCELKILFRDENLGCKYAVSEAITWFFDNEEEGIILEDDILPASDFFHYCEFLLDYYRDKHEIMMISGCNPVSSRYESPYTYDFSIYAVVWGWASWRRAWKRFDLNMHKWPSYNMNRQLSKLPKVGNIFPIIWTDIYEKTYLNKLNTWDYQWFFSIHLNCSFVIIPNINLTINIGYGEDATHCNQGMPEYARNLITGDMPKNYIHPLVLENNEKIDRLFEKVLFGVNRFTYIKYVIKKILGPNIVKRATSMKSLLIKEIIL
jgi:hypothetical protein